MAERTHKQRQSPDRTEQVVESAPPATAGSDKLKAELDDLLDEIDDVLETNAEDFVKSYVQKGGQ
jgi:ubiquitin-like protein Pup